MNKKSIINIIGNITMVLSLIYIGKKIISSNLNFSNIFSLKLVFSIIIGTFAYGIVVNIGALVFFYLLRHFLKHSINFDVVCSTYLKTNLYKYLPGNIFHYIGRNQIAEIEDLSHVKVALMTSVEIILQIITVILIMLFFSGEDVRILIDQYLPRQILFIGAFIFLFLFVFIIVLILINKKLQQKLINYFHLIQKTNLSFFPKAIILYGICFVIYGLIYILVLDYFGVKLHFVSYPAVIGLNALSWLIGFITPGAPGGLGIREVIMTTIFANFAPQDALLTSVLINRMISIFGDLFAYFSYPIFRKCNQNSIFKSNCQK